MSDKPQEVQRQPDQPQELQPQLDQPQESLPPQPQPKKTRRQFLIIGGSAALVVVLAGAAYLAGNYMNRNLNNQNNPNGGQVLSPGGGSLSQGGGPNTQGRTIDQSQVTPAPELPTIQADTRGVFLSRSGNTFTIGSGAVQIGVQANSSGQATQTVNYDGPTYEVVFTKDTVIYKDTTPMEPGDTGPIQQTVASGTLDDLNTMTMIAVWGKKTGDRYVADVILYTQPQMKLNGGSGGTLK